MSQVNIKNITASFDIKIDAEDKNKWQLVQQSEIEVEDVEIVMEGSFLNLLLDLFHDTIV